MVFRVFWGNSRDFAEKPEIRGSATARIIRSPVVLVMNRSPSLFSRHGLRPSIFSGSARIEGVRVGDSGIPLIAPEKKNALID